MDTLTRSHLQALVAEQPGLCASIYTETNRGGRERDHVQFRDQLDELQKRFKDLGVSESDIGKWLKPARDLVKNEDFWKSTSDGLAAFIRGGSLQTFRLPIRFKNAVFVGSHFHVKPLIPWFMGDGQFHILAISQNHVRLLEASAHDAHPLAMPGAPANKEDALRSHDRDEILNVHTQMGPGGQAMQAIFHGHGVGIDTYKPDITKYFQAVDQAVCDALGDTRAPLVLATVDFLAGIYRKVTKHPRLVETIVSGNPDRQSETELHAKAWPIVAPMLGEREERTLAQYRQLVGSGRTTHTLSELLPAAYRGELESLLLVKDAEAWGKFEPAAGSIEEHPKPAPADEELTNLAAVYMLRRDRQVQTVAAEAAFDRAPMAGIYFVPMAHHGKSRR